MASKKGYVRDVRDITSEPESGSNNLRWVEAKDGRLRYKDSSDSGKWIKKVALKNSTLKVSYNAGSLFSFRVNFIISPHKESAGVISMKFQKVDRDIVEWLNALSCNGAVLGWSSDFNIPLDVRNVLGSVEIPVLSKSGGTSPLTAPDYPNVYSLTHIFCSTTLCSSCEAEKVHCCSNWVQSNFAALVHLPAVVRYTSNESSSVMSLTIWLFIK
jgi:hypothetical protein